MRSKSKVIKRNVEKAWGGRYTLGAPYLPKKYGTNAMRLSLCLVMRGGTIVCIECAPL
jgi:hypothetical protein